MNKIKEHRINKEDNMFIGGYYCPDKILDPIVEWCNSLDLKGGISMGTDGKTQKWDGEEKTFKECYEQGIVWPTLGFKPMDRFLDWVQYALGEYMEKYPMLNSGGQFKMDPNFNFQKYPKGHAYNGWHCERAGYASTNRMLVWMIYLNDCKDGGETAFLYQKLKIKPEKGLVLFWPSDFTHTHKGIPSYKTEKMIMTGWYSYIQNNGGALMWQ